MKEKISEHISYEEATASSAAERLGIDNTPSQEQLEAMKNIATKIFDRLRDNFGCRIAVTSFFRCAEVNAELEKNSAVMASRKSQHMLGEAIDINGNVYGGVTNRQIFDWIRKNAEFDQLIWEDINGNAEPEWIHVSMKAGEGVKNRKEMLRRFREDGKSRYEKMSKEGIIE